MYVLRQKVNGCSVAFLRLAGAIDEPGDGRDPGLQTSIRDEGTAMSELTKGLTVNEIDVRSLVPAQRHARIFQLVDELDWNIWVRSIEF